MQKDFYRASSRIGIGAALRTLFPQGSEGSSPSSPTNTELLIFSENTKTASLRPTSKPGEERLFSRSPIYEETLILLILVLASLGMRTVKIPFFKIAFELSESISSGSIIDLENGPQ